MNTENIKKPKDIKNSATESGYVPGVRYLDISKSKNGTTMFFKKYIKKIPFRVGNHIKRFDVAEELIEATVLKIMRKRMVDARRQLLAASGWTHEGIEENIRQTTSKPIGFNEIPTTTKVVGT